jgi:hypothetical protein
VAVTLRRGALLVGGGLISEVIYLAVTARLPWWRYGGTLRGWSQLLGGQLAAFGACLAGIAVLVAAYLLGWRIVRGGDTCQPERRIVWGFAGLFGLTLFWLMPITSDLFLYLTQAHLFTDLGVNPLLDAALDFGGLGLAGERTLDPLVLAYPAFFASTPSVYGPAWTLFSAPGTLGPYDVAAGLFYLKGLAIVAYLGCAWLLERILRQIRPAFALEGLYLFAWNPLVLFMAVGDGHNDVVMMATMLLACWLLLQDRWMLAFGALALSVWLKYVSVIFIPLFVLYAWFRLTRGRRGHLWPVMAQSGLAVLAVSALVLAPFGPIEWGGGMVERLLRPVNWRGDAADLSALFFGVGLLLFAGMYVTLSHRLFKRPDSFQQLLDATFVVSLLAFLLGAARSQPWHFIWPTVLAGFSKRRWAWPVVIGLSAFMLVSQVWIEWGVPGLGIMS